MIYKKALICKTKNLFDVSKADVTQQNEYWLSNVGASSNFYKLNTLSTEDKQYSITYEYFSNALVGGQQLLLSVQTGDNYYDGTRLRIALAPKKDGQWETQHLTFTVPANTEYITLSTNSGTAYFRNFQLEEGSTATPYQPYGYLQSYKKAIKVSDICQLVNSKLFTPMNNDDYALAGVSITKNIEAGTITFNGTSTNNFWYHVHDFGSELKYTNLIKGYKYYISGMPVNDLGVVFQLTSLFNLQGEQIFTAPKTSDGTGAFNIYVPKGVTLTDFVVTPQLFNLTEMYKAGNEPTTVEEFKSRWYKNLFDIHTEWEYPIASASAVNLKVTNNAVTGTVLSSGGSAAISTEKLLIQTNSAGDKIYYISGETNGDNIVLIRLTDAEGNLITTNGNWTYNQYYKAFLAFMNGIFNIQNDNAVYLQFGLRFSGTGIGNTVTFTNIQLEKGSTSTPYVPYTPNPAPYRPYCFVYSYKKYLKIKENNNA